MSKAKKSFWVVAAGTGGHIIPGLEVAKQIEEKLASQEIEADFTFFGTVDRLESKIIPKEGRKLEHLWVKPIKGKGLFDKLTAVVSMLVSSFDVFIYAIATSRPSATISVGGYVSVPVVLISKLFRIPVYLIEPNIRAGASNRQLSRFARLAFSVLGSDAGEKFACEVENLGNPVRGDFQLQPIRSEVRTVAVLGGSQGARYLSENSLHVFKELLEWSPKLNLIIQAGKDHMEEIENLVEENGLGKRCKVYGFVRDMAKLLSVTDLVIARAGAMTIAELSITGLPTVFVPFPFAADDHQRINAKILARKQASLMIEEGEGFRPALSAGLRELILSKNSFQKRIKMSELFRKFSKPDAAEKIASVILEDCEKQN